MKNNIGTKRECCLLIKEGKILVNGTIADNPNMNIYHNDIIMFNNQVLDSSPLVYYMLNKPSGYISATKDINPCVLDLFDRDDLCIAGRLDKDTTGLMILSNDKSFIKKITLPNFHVSKKYLVHTLNKLCYQDVIRCKDGIIIDNDILCKPALLEIIDDYNCFITISEGKYHQVKKMFLSLNNKVLSLKRVSIGEVVLDDHLKEGEYRKLTDDEVLSLKKYVK